MVVLVTVGQWGRAAGYCPRPGGVWRTVSEMAPTLPAFPISMVFVPLCVPFLLSVGWTWSLASNEWNIMGRSF